MAPSLHLVRHGPSAHVHTGAAIDHAGVHQWLEAYDAAGILSLAQPPARVTRLAAEATHLVASDLPRAIASAERLAPGRALHVSPLLREAPLTVPRWPTRLPLSGWEFVIHARWVYDRIRDIHPDEGIRTRVRAAADWLTDLVADGSTACVVTHGVVRLLIGRELNARGWTATGRDGGYRNWSSWSFDGPVSP